MQKKENSIKLQEGGLDMKKFLEAMMVEEQEDWLAVSGEQFKWSRSECGFSARQE